MEESYKEDIASSSGLKPYAGIDNDTGVASERGDAGQPLSSDIIHPVCRSCHDMEKATSSAPHNGKVQKDTAESKTLSMCQNSKRENREILLISTAKEGEELREGSCRNGTNLRHFDEHLSGLKTIIALAHFKRIHLVHAGCYC